MCDLAGTFLSLALLTCEMGMVDNNFMGMQAALNETMYVKHFLCAINSWSRYRPGRRLVLRGSLECAVCKTGLCLQAANYLIRRVSMHINRVGETGSSLQNWENQHLECDIQWTA